MLRNRVSRLPLQRKLLPVLVIFLSITVVSLALTFVALAIQSSVRGYVAGEGLWSKSQRDAVFLLERYGRTQNPDYLRRFDTVLAIPLGDRKARLELQKSGYDPAIATQGFLEGGNHADDIPGMIQLFRCCSQLSYLRKAIELWTQGDQNIVELQGIARDLKAAIGSAEPSAQRIESLLKQVEKVNDTVQPLEASFTATLGDAARWVTELLFLVTTGIIVLLILLGAYISWRILHGIHQSEEQYRLLLNTASDALIVIDRDSGAMLEVNAKAEQLMGKPGETLIGAAYDDLFPAPQNPAGDAPAASDKSRATRQRIRQKDGRVVTVEVNYSATEWGDRPVHLAIIRDITERIQVERDLRVAANAMTNMAEGVVITDARRRIVSINRAYSTITGYREGEVLGATPHYPLSRHNDPGLYRSLWKAVHKYGHWQGEIWNQRKNGEVYPELLSISGVRDDAGRISHYVGVFNDISAYKDYERRLHHLAHHDPLTQLPNRAAFEELCARAMERATRERSQMALLFIDLDGFKVVNDTYGHAAGDELLRVIGERIRAGVRGDDAVARVGGDEFTVLLQNIAGLDSAKLVAQKLLKGLPESVSCAGHEVSVFASIGVSFFPKDATDVQTLLTHADTAMYEAKKRGRNNHQFFAPGMALETSSRLALTRNLKLAIGRSEFELYYQPCVNLASGEIVSTEALLRWRSAELGAVAPSTFVPLAEEIGLINAITAWVLESACRQGVAWHRAGIKPLPIAVNVSPRSFWDADFPAKVAEILENTGWRADWLTLEITESTLMNPERPDKMLKQLQAMGISLAIDDFGIGYSSLSYLKHLPVHYLKIDRFFTKSIPDDASNLAIAKTIIALGKNLNLRIIAEGVENQEQYQVLRNEGCDEGQGYLFSKPLPANEIESLLKTRCQWRPGAELRRLNG